MLVEEEAGRSTGGKLVVAGVWRQDVMQYIPYSAFPRFVRVIIAFISLGVVPLSCHGHDSEEGSTGGAFRRECVTLGSAELNDRLQTGIK